MDSRVRHFFDSIYGKKIAFCGIGISNLPLCALFAKYGARVIACDRKDRQALGEFGQKLEEYGIALKCGPDYLENLDVDIISARRVSIIIWKNYSNTGVPAW